jgi:hypothetical protein
MGTPRTSFARNGLRQGKAAFLPNTARRCRPVGVSATTGPLRAGTSSGPIWGRRGRRPYQSGRASVAMGLDVRVAFVKILD